MNKITISILAFTGGVALAAQSGLNSQLGEGLSYTTKHKRDD